MKPFLPGPFHTMASTLRERVHLALEVMALRHQLAVLARSGKGPDCSQENALGGVPRIHGQLATLGIKVSRTTVVK
jgi:hypothetical protein